MKLSKHKINSRIYHSLLLGMLCGLLIWGIFLSGCDSSDSPIGPVETDTPQLTSQEVTVLMRRAVDVADQLGEKVVVAVTDREGNLLGAFSMTDTQGTLNDAFFGAEDKARTAGYLSSNQHGFTTLTACFITRSHFPPGLDNLAGGPLYGVPFSSLGGGDVQPNGGPGVGAPGLTGIPGGVPVFKDGLLAGALGISSYAGDVQQFISDFPDFLENCGGETVDEAIALAAVSNFGVPEDKRGDNIFIDGIRLLFAGVEPENIEFRQSLDVASLGTVIAAARDAEPPKFPSSGEVNLGPGFDFSIRGSARGDANALTENDVRTIINQAIERADNTRAAIRRPIGTPARTFITVVDLDGTVLGIWRTPDATLFSYDVSAQKARTVVAFSDPNGPSGLGQLVRTALGLDANAPLAMTCRAVGFMSQRFFPPGIDVERLGRALEPGPFYVPSSISPAFDFQFQLELGLVSFPNGSGNGITIFPGAVPLYKNGELVGGIGVSGDGVDQDDIIAFSGAVGFEPPEEIRCDQFTYNGIRLPYVKFPRRPEID